MNKPSILIIGNFHSHPSAEAFLRKFLRLIVPLSQKVALISGDLPEEFRDEVTWFKTELKTDSAIFVRRAINYNLSQLRSAVYLAKLIANDAYNTLIFLGAHPLPILVSKILKKKTILYQGGSYSRQTFGDKIGLREYPLILFFETLPWILSDKIIVESRSCLKFQKIEKYKRKTVIAHLYVDERVFCYLKQFSKRDMYIGYVGDLDENKGAHEFLEAIVVLQDYIKFNGVKVIVSGDGPLLCSFKRRIELTGLSESVTFTGWIKQEEVTVVLNELRLLVLPFHSEGLPNILLEAMACGTPVLLAPVGAIPDVIKDGETGFFLKSNDPKYIADKIVDFLGKPHLLENISQNARKLVFENFSYEKDLESWRKVF
jgi:glycosyltransferase involved in cell wall biosynthesis